MRYNAGKDILPQRVEKLATLHKGQQPRTAAAAACRRPTGPQARLLGRRPAATNASVSPFENPFDKILRQIAHSEHSSSHTICRKISLEVSPSSAHVRRRRRFYTF